MVQLFKVFVLTIDFDDFWRLVGGLGLEGANADVVLDGVTVLGNVIGEEDSVPMERLKSYLLHLSTYTYMVGETRERLEKKENMFFALLISVSINLMY